MASRCSAFVTEGHAEFLLKMVEHKAMGLFPWEFVNPVTSLQMLWPLDPVKNPALW